MAATPGAGRAELPGRAAAAAAGQADVAVARRAMRKVKLYLLPVFVLVVAVSYLDRGNIGYAAVDLKQLLGLNDAGYGAVAGSLFYTYVLFQWPHALVARRVGVRRWLAFVVALWGAATVAMAGVRAVWQAVALRLVIGFAEAGAFPLIYMHLDSFLTDKEVAFCWSIVIASSQVASIFAGPIAAGLIQLPVGPWITASWQWLFVIEGVMAIAAALVVLLCLVDSFESTEILTAAEKEAIRVAKAAGCKGARGGKEAEVSEEDGQDSHLPPARPQDICAGAKDWRAWYIGMVNLFISTPVYAFMFFSPMLIRSVLGPETPKAVVYTMNGVPYLCATLLMVLCGFTIKLLADRLYHGIIGMCLAALLAFSFPAVFTAGQAQATFAHLSILYGISAAMYIPVDTMPSAYCKDSAGSYSIVNSVKSVSGIVGPILFGLVKDELGGPAAVAALGCFEILGLVSLVLFFVFIGQARSSFGCRARRRADGDKAVLDATQAAPLPKVISKEPPKQAEQV